MRHLIALGGAALAMFAAGAAGAADLPARPAPPPRAPAFVAQGYNWSGFYISINGGGAWVNDKYDARLTTGALIDSASETRTGWTVGGGLEYGFMPGWSIAVEYDHYDFGNKALVFNPGAVNERISQRIDTVTARLNWRFGWGGPVVARY